MNNCYLLIYKLFYLINGKKIDRYVKMYDLCLKYY